MKKSGLNKSHKLSATDISLIIIVAFCLLVFVFIGYNCCQRRRAKRKRKPEQRKIVKGRKRDENVKLLGSSQQSNDLEGQGANITGQPSSDENPENKTEKSPTSSPNPDDRSLLSRIMSYLCSRGTSDTETSSDCQGASTSKQDSPRTRRGASEKDSSPGCEMVELQEVNSSKSRETDKDLKKNGVRKADRSVVPSKTTPSDDDPLKSRSRSTEHLAGIYSERKSKNSSKLARGDCTRNCTGKACKKCRAVENKDDGSYNNDDTNKTNSTTDQEKHLIKHEKDEARNKEKRSRNGNESKVGIYETRSKVTKPGRTGTEGIQPSLDDDVSHEMNTEDYDMCEDDTRHDKAKRNTPMNVDEELIIKEIADAAESDVHTKDEMEIDNQDKPTIPQNEASARQYGGTIGRFMEEKRIESIGEIFNVMQYARKEWKSETATAKAVREGYFEIVHLLGLTNLRVVRGDNYCAIRATLFQVLAKNIPILSQLGKIEELPQELIDSGINWIDDWNFARRLPVGRTEVCKEIKACLTELSSLVGVNAKMSQEEGRVTHLLSKFNFTPELEIRLLEAVKFLMLYRAIQLERKIKANEDVPIFAMIMFARDTSQDAWHFMAKHLNAVGDTGGLEQVEMHLLGYTLGITIKVVRPSHFGQSDFIALYPEDMPGGSDVITLVAEDDRHYNILS